MRDAKASFAHSAQGTGIGRGSLVVALALAALFLVFAPSALATQIYSGTATGSFTTPANPRSVAVDKTSGAVYVMVGTNAATYGIDKFTAAGVADNFSALGTNVIDGKGTGNCATVPADCDQTPANSFAFNVSAGARAQIAVDNSGGPANGDIYVTDSTHNVVDIFDSTGTYKGQLNGSSPSPNPFTEVCGVAVGATGRLYVASVNGRVYRYNAPTTQPIANADYNSQISGLGTICNIAVDRSGGVWVNTYGATQGVVRYFDASQFGVGAAFTQPAGTTPYRTVATDSDGDVYLGQTTQIREYSPEGTTQFASFGSGNSANPRGIAFNPFGNAYVSDSSNSKVFIFGPPSVLPNAFTAATAPIAQMTATLNGIASADGTTSPALDLTDCHFEWGLNAPSYGHTAPCSPAFGSIPTDIADHAVSSALTNLAANTDYHYRLVTASAAGTTASPDRVFHTLPYPPNTALTPDDSIGSTAIAKTTAEFSGTVNPNGDSLSACHVEYGTDNTYGQTQNCDQSLGSIGSGNDPVAVTVSLSSLTANTLYHYHVVTTNSGGATDSGDRTFTTLADPPIVATLANGALTYDSAVLNGTVDNRGALAGSFCLFDIVPAADPDGYGSLDALTVPCSDLPVLTGDGVATPVTGTATGLEPNTDYAYRAFAFNSAGVVLGADQTFTTPPAPPTISDEAAGDISQTKASLSAKVNPNDTQVSGCEIEWGTSDQYGTTTPCTEDPGAGHDPASVSIPELTNLTPDTTYHFRVNATNGGGTTTGDDHSFKTLADTCETNASLCPPPPPTCATDASLCPPPPPTCATDASLCPPPPPKHCKKGFVKRGGKCVRKHHKKRHHKRNHHRGGSR